MRTSNAFKNLGSSFLKPEQVIKLFYVWEFLAQIYDLIRFKAQSSKDQKFSKEELSAVLVKGRENPQELAKILYPNRSGKEEVFEKLISHLGLNNNTKKDPGKIKSCLF